MVKYTETLFSTIAILIFTSLVFAASFEMTSAQESSTIRPYDGIQASRDTYQYHEARRRAAFSQQLEINDYYRWRDFLYSGYLPRNHVPQPIGRLRIVDGDRTESHPIYAPPLPVVEPTLRVPIPNDSRWDNRSPIYQPDYFQPDYLQPEVRPAQPPSRSKPEPSDSDLWNRLGPA